MILLDTDVMVEVYRGNPAAVRWLDGLGEEELGLPGFVVLELIYGCRNKRELDATMKLAGRFPVLWPGAEDCDRALADYARSKLSHNLSMLDALIGQCAVGLDCLLYTFNARHFSLIKGLRHQAPFPR